MNQNAIMLRRRLLAQPKPYRSRWWAHLRSGLMGFIPVSYAKTPWGESFASDFDRRAQVTVEGQRTAT